MKIYGVYNVNANNTYDRVQEIDRYYLSREDALEFIVIQGGYDVHLDDWLVELELITENND